MTRLEFNELVELLAERYEGRPAALARATAVWIALGHAALFSGLVLSLVLGLGLMGLGWWLGAQWSFLLVVAGAVIAVFGVSMSVQLLWSLQPPLKERVLQPEDAPRLFELIEEVRQAAGCRPFQRVLLKSDVNAGVFYQPRLGILGRRTSLAIGLPLMDVVTPQEFRAILAHEFVHHSRAHGRFSVWVYRVRSTWEKYFREIESNDQKTSVRLARRFIRWYWPRMNARAFLLCRQHEFQADRFAAEHAGAEAIATSLWRSENCDRYLDIAFWPDIHRLPERLPEPPDDLVDRIASCLALPPRTDVASWCESSTHARLTDSADTHPSWFDRTEALGVSPAAIAQRGYPGRPSATAADAYLGPARSQLASEASKLWAETWRENWTARHRRLVGLRRRLEQIRPLIEARPADLSLRWEEAELVRELDGLDAARPLLERIRELSPQHRGAIFALGVVALSTGDASGESLLEEIVEQQRDSYYDTACNTLEVYYRLSGRFAEMRAMEARLDGRDAWSEWLREGHRHIGGNVRCEPHGLAPEQLAALMESLRRQAKLAAAWLVRVGDPGSPPVFVLCVSSGVGRFSPRRATAEHDLARQLVGQVTLPGRLLVIPRHGYDAALARRVLAVTNSQLLPDSGPLGRS